MTAYHLDHAHYDQTQTCTVVQGVVRLSMLDYFLLLRSRKTSVFVILPSGCTHIVVTHWSEHSPVQVIQLPTTAGVHLLV